MQTKHSLDPKFFNEDGSLNVESAMAAGRRAHSQDAHESFKVACSSGRARAMPSATSIPASLRADDLGATSSAMRPKRQTVYCGWARRRKPSAPGRRYSSALTMPSHISLASPNNIIVLSRKNSSLSMPA